MQAIEHDFRAGGSTEEAARWALEGLLACFQHFLGHDLPNRLVGAQGLARIILADADLTPSAMTRPRLEKLADLIRLADEEVRQFATLGRLVRDLEPPARVDLREFCQEAAAEARWLCRDPHIRYHIGDNLPVASISYRLARAVLVQTLRLAAAAKFPRQPLRVEVTAAEETEAAVFHVRHDGRGLSPEQLVLLAKLWNQGQADHPSLGPGWLLVRHLIAACGGAIRVSSAPEAGMTVSLTLRVPPISSGPVR